MVVHISNLPVFAGEATILVVDDTPANLSLMSSLLKDTYKVKVANCGDRALEIAQSDAPPDLILLDIMMPGIDVRLAKTFKLEQGRRAELAMVVQNANKDDYTKYGTVNRVAEVPFTRRAWLTAALNF